MTAKEKALQLFYLFDKIPRYAKRAVDEILIIMNEEYLSGALKIEYWQEVKKEIEKL